MWICMNGGTLQEEYEEFLEVIQASFGYHLEECYKYSSLCKMQSLRERILISLRKLISPP